MDGEGLLAAAGVDQSVAALARDADDAGVVPDPVTERFRQESQLREWSIHDALTGCFNRRYLAELTAGPAAGWGCIVFDLDHFKQVNDTHGHARGDEVLVAMATFLRNHVRPQDAVIRLGGDEFLVLLRGAGEELTQGVVDRLDPKVSIHAAARYLRTLKDKLPPRIQEPDRTWLALAAFNIGLGHLEDARILAQKQKLNPDLWSDVKKTLPLLAQPDRPWKKAVFSQYPKGGRLGTAMETERYRYVEWRQDGRVVDRELYDHRDDPEENENVAGRPGYAAALGELERQLAAGWKAARP